MKKEKQRLKPNSVFWLEIKRNLMFSSEYLVFVGGFLVKNRFLLFSIFINELKSNVNN